MAINPSELPIHSRVVIGPSKLVSDHPYPHWILNLDVLKPVRSFRPQGEGETKQEHRLKNSHPDLKMRGHMILHPMVGSLRTTALPELPAGQQEESGPAHKERKHEPVHQVDQVIHATSMLGVVLRDAQKLDKGLSEKMHNWLGKRVKMGGNRAASIQHI